jgi:hypothetical protein
MILVLIVLAFVSLIPGFFFFYLLCGIFDRLGDIRYLLQHGQHALDPQPVIARLPMSAGLKACLVSVLTAVVLLVAGLAITH